MLIFHYQAKKPELERVLPHIDPNFMIWPPHDMAVTEQSTSRPRQIAVKRSFEEDSDSQSSSSGLKYTLVKRQWKPSTPSKLSQRAIHDEQEETPVRRRRTIQSIDYNEDKDQQVSLLEYADGYESENSQPTISTTEPHKHASHTSLITGAPRRKKARTNIHRLDATTPESSHILPEDSEPGNPSKTSSSVTFKASAQQSTRYSSLGKKDDSDDWVEILDFAPSAFGRSARVKVENSAEEFKTISTDVSPNYLEEPRNLLYPMSQ